MPESFHLSAVPGGLGATRMSMVMAVQEVVARLCLHCKEHSLSADQSMRVEEAERGHTISQVDPVEPFG